MASRAALFATSEANSFAIAASLPYDCFVSLRYAARSVSRRAASISVAMSASLNAIAWCCAIGLPNVRRCCAYAGASFRADPNAAASEHKHRALEAAADVAEHVVVKQVNVIEENLRRLAAADAHLVV